MDQPLDDLGSSSEPVDYAMWCYVRALRKQSIFSLATLNFGLSIVNRQEPKNAKG